MARFTALQKDDRDQFDRLLNGTDLTVEEVLKLNKNPEVLQIMLASMRSHEAFRLIHGIYNSVEDVKAMADAKVRAAGFNPDKHEWIGDLEPPCFEKTNENVVVVLYDTLDSLGQTTEFYWSWIVEGHTKNWRSPELKTDLHHLRDFRDPEHKQWRPRTRRWVRIDLFANNDKSPEWTRKNVDHNQIAGLEVMAAMAQHPKAAPSSKPWLNLTALDFNIEVNGRPWQFVLNVSFYRGRVQDERSIRLTANFVGLKSYGWSCPMLL